MKILCITPIKHIKGVWGILHSCGPIIYLPHASRQEVRNIVNRDKPDALFVNPNSMLFRIDRSILGKSIKFICTASTGLNHIDMKYCNDNGITVLSLTTDYPTIKRITSTAEMAFGLMLSLIRNIPSSYRSVQNSSWEYEPFIGRQLDHLSIGIVGYGRLGQMMEKYCLAFGMRVHLSDPGIDIHADISVDQLVSTVDVLSLHVHLNDVTRHMINSAVLGKAKGMYLINTSRGEIVDERAVIDSLENGELKGYATDVLSDELGNIQNSNLISASRDLNIIITPHIGGMTKEAQEIAYTAVARKLAATS